MNFLMPAQKVLLSQAARHQSEGHWWGLMQSYTAKLIKICVNLSKKITGPEVTGTIIDQLLPNLVISMCLFKLDLSFISATIQPVMSLVNQFNSLNIAGTESHTRKVTEIVESPHNYANAARETHWVRVPGAQKFKLTFDE